MFYLKIRANICHNAYLLAGREPHRAPGRNKASLESRAEFRQERKRRKGKEKKKEKRKKKLHITLERAEDYSEITHMGASREV